MRLRFVVVRGCSGSRSSRGSGRWCWKSHGREVCDKPRGPTGDHGRLWADTGDHRARREITLLWLLRVRLPWTLFVQNSIRYSDLANGFIAQWLERLTADQQVPGSNPGEPSFRRLYLWTWFPNESRRRG